MGGKWQTLEGQLLDRVWIVPNGCWLKMRGLTRKDYGQINVAGKIRRAHIVAHEYWVGPVPDGLFVCHSCDNPACIRPDHLFLGTAQDNTDDMMSKNRSKGSNCRHSKRMWSKTDPCKPCIKEYNRRHWLARTQGSSK